MQIICGKITARCRLCHHTGFQQVRDKQGAAPALMMCNACGTETEYSVLVAQLAHFTSHGRDAIALR